MEKQSFEKKMNSLGMLLNYVWENSLEWANYGYLVGPNQIKISARNDDYSHKGRIEFSSVYLQRRFTKVNIIEITVTETKTPEQISRDIQKRFLPDYLENLKKIIQANRDADDYEARKLINIKKIADYLGEEIRSNDHIYPVLKEIYKIESCGDAFVKIEIHDCTPEKAIEIIKVLKELQNDKKINDKS